jgi:sec-independent protein translocase protein TatC
MALSIFRRKEGDELDEQEMSFMDHLEILRWHIMRAILAVLIASITIFIYIDEVFDYVIMGPLRPDFVTYSTLCKLSKKLKLGDSLCLPPPKVDRFLNEFGTQFMSAINIGLVGGVIVAFPYIFWEFWRFIKPALTTKELKNTRGAILFVSFFFFTGAAFGFFLLAPFTLSFLSNFTMGNFMANNGVTPNISNYIDTLVDVTLGSAISFQLPVVSFILTKIGLITPMFLKNYRKYAYVGILVVAAIITPSPDVSSQMLVFFPLLALYEFSIFVSKRVFTAEEALQNQ